MSLLKLFSELEVTDISYDSDVDAAYISLGGKGRKPGTVKNTLPVDHGIICDFDEEGNILGIEVLWVRDQVRKWVNYPKPEDPATLNVNRPDRLVPSGRRLDVTSFEIGGHASKVIRRRFE